MAIPAQLRRQVIHRAQDHCEYCGIGQAAQEATFHVDHIIPRNSGGETNLDNLALACVSCSLHKGARLTARDPKTGKEVRLFDPRHDSRRLHFRWDGVRAVGISPTGRATVCALELNRPAAQFIRHEEIFRKRHPAPGHL